MSSFLFGIFFLIEDFIFIIYPKKYQDFFNPCKTLEKGLKSQIIRLNE